MRTSPALSLRRWRFAATLTLGMVSIQEACAQKSPAKANAATTPSSFPSGKWATFVRPAEGDLRKRLTPLQYEVTQEAATETPFNNVYWNNHEAGIYVDVVSGEPLFSSTDKFESGTGWPSFTKPLMPENITTKVDHELGMERTEVRSKYANSHLGHLFDDGPKPLGLRYCMNSASMRFIPASRLTDEGYGAFAKLFAKTGN